jgi:hypothetical protein
VLEAYTNLRNKVQYARYDTFSSPQHEHFPEFSGQVFNSAWMKYGFELGRIGRQVTPGHTVAVSLDRKWQFPL